MLHIGKKEPQTSEKKHCLRGSVGKRVSSLILRNKRGGEVISDCRRKKSFLAIQGKEGTKEKKTTPEEGKKGGGKMPRVGDQKRALPTSAQKGGKNKEKGGNIIINRKAASRSARKRNKGRPRGGGRLSSM